jgi:hypothetical protein
MNSRRLEIFRVKAYLDSFSALDSFHSNQDIYILFSPKVTGPEDISV